MSAASTPSGQEAAGSGALELDERDAEPRTPMKRLGSTRKLGAFTRLVQSATRAHHPHTGSRKRNMYTLRILAVRKNADVCTRNICNVDTHRHLSMYAPIYRRTRMCVCSDKKTHFRKKTHLRRRALKLSPQAHTGEKFALPPRYHFLSQVGDRDDNLGARVISGREANFPSGQYGIQGPAQVSRPGPSRLSTPSHGALVYKHLAIVSKSCSTQLLLMHRVSNGLATNGKGSPILQLRDAAHWETKPR
ncbi:hypothetical protein EVAR_97345_1 [Eumeta japonica]|uniref:Uncharacterized protein n=1 Tax=Eumeta variegata TaxID=151549 RepID=A0A4C1X7E9_EUMVA|nr:hypothetical protein EVAR_97345_1 [Eumeta japonica]